MRNVECGMRNERAGFEPRCGGSTPPRNSAFRIPHSALVWCMNRRDTVKLLAAGVGFWLTPLEVRRAAEVAAKARSAGSGDEPKFFTPPEWGTGRGRVDLVTPRGGRSGSGADARGPRSRR